MHRKIVARRDGVVVGVLPLVHQRSRLFGDQLVSMPWFDACGIVADDDSVRLALVKAAEQLRESLGADTVQLRQSRDEGISPACRTDKVLMRLQLPRDPEELWFGLKPKVRNQVRKGQKAGLKVISGGVELLGDFFEVYARNMRDLGSPSHSKAFFAAICKNFADETRIWRVQLEGVTVGAGFTMANGQILEIPWASSLREFNHLCVNHAMYWQILESACRDGFEWFHFGRSSVDSGTYRFKKQWGAEAFPLHWYFFGEPQAVKDALHDPGESFGLARQVWQRLPVSVTRRLGPRLISKLA